MIDLPDTSQIPVVAEPFFARFDAHVTLTPVMNIDDLQRGIASLEEAAAVPV